MLDIRVLCQPRGRENWKPMEWRRQYQRCRAAGSLADWMHNLAHYAAMNFSGFDADWFWREYESLSQRQAGMGHEWWIDYRKRYDEWLARLNTAD